MTRLAPFLFWFCIFLVFVNYVMLNVVLSVPALGVSFKPFALGLVASAVGVVVNYMGIVRNREP